MMAKNSRPIFSNAAAILRYGHRAAAASPLFFWDCGRVPRQCAILWPMSRRITTFLLWFFIVALPAQGFAAVVRASCGSGQQSVAQSHASALHTLRDADVGHNHAAMLHAAAVTDADDATASDTTNPSHKHTSALCKTCGHCCIGGIVLPMHVRLTLPTFGLLVEVQHPDVRRAGFIPDSPDRPPRKTFI